VTTAKLSIRHQFTGGWATDFGVNSDNTPNPNGIVQLPFLLNAEDCVYELDGGPRMVGGATKLNSSALESGAVIKGIFDYWDIGTAGAPSQHRVIYVGTTIKNDDADGSFSNLFTGLQPGGVPSFCILEDLLVISLDTSDTPKSWDGSTAQALAGSPPNFAFCIEHKNKLWAAGVDANSSRLYYSVSLNGADWSSSGSGSIDISPRDGDRITGLISFKNELWVFKGPYKGSIHRITGSAPTGDDAFARKTFTQGVGSVGHNTIFIARDDVGFMWSDGTIHSLKATEAFGDFSESTLTRPININFIDKRFNFNRLKHAWAANDSANGKVWFAVPIDSSQNNNVMLCMDYRFEPVRWSLIVTISGGALALVVDPGAANRHIIMIGGNDGFVRKFGQARHSIDGATKYNYKVTTPFLTYGVPVIQKTITEAAIGIFPKNDGNITLIWRRDDEAEQSVTITQGGGDVLGTASANQFTLGTSKLSGDQFLDRFNDTLTGAFRAIQYEWTSATLNEDIEVHSLSAAIEGGNWSTEL
jgi:hypothetical protein